MATSSPEPSAKLRHLRPRESTKKTPGTDIPSGLSKNTPMSTVTAEEDDELSTNTTASYYIGRTAMKRRIVTVHNSPKRRRVLQSGHVGEKNPTTPTDNADVPNAEEGHEELQDVYCWECHKECVDGALDCVSCPRTFHPVCVSSALAQECGLTPSGNWTCPVCLTIMKAECADTRSWAMQQLNMDQLCTILGFALRRMKHTDTKTSEAFHNPVPKTLCPDYYDIIFHPMDLSRLDRNIKKKMYASTEAYYEDTKWILHNSLIYNGEKSKLTQDARLIVKICRHELTEIELCPDCYLTSSIQKDNWFSEPCTSPHCLVWAKLKGFPYWPAKALRVSSGNNVDVRFFGAHDRSWIPMNQVYLLSAECPLPIKNPKKFGYENAVNELHLHIKLVREKFGEFSYAPLKTEFKPEHLYYCSILFGTTLANSEAAQKMVAASTRRRYSDSGNIVTDDDKQSSVCQATASETSDDQHHGSAVDDGQLSDAEDSEHNDVSMTKNLKNSKTEVVEKMQSANPNAEPEPSAMDAEEKDQDDGAVEEDDSMLDQPPIGPIQPMPAPTIRTLVPSPDSTSPSGGITSTSSTETLQATTRTATLENGQPESQAGYLTPAGTNVGSKATTSKEDDAATKKRSLQSVLQKMHSNAQQLQHHRSVSPCVGDISVVSTESASKPIQSTKNTSVQTTRFQLEQMVHGGASAMDHSSVCDNYAEKIKQYIKSTISELVHEVQPTPPRVLPVLPQETAKESQAHAQAALLRQEYSKMQTFYNEAIRAMKNTAKTTFTELQQTWEAEKAKLLEDMKRKFEEEVKKAVVEAKSKQWCANCGKEAVFYCCWNTSYCNYPCQQQHWPKHQPSCAQMRPQQGSDTGARANVVGSSTVSAVVRPVGGQRPSNQISQPPQQLVGPAGNFVCWPELQGANVFRAVSISTNNAGQATMNTTNLANMINRKR